MLHIAQRVQLRGLQLDPSTAIASCASRLAFSPPELLKLVLTALVVAICLVAHPNAASATQVQSADLSDVIGTSGIFSFATLLRLLETTVAQVIAIVCILGGVYELRQNKELGALGIGLMWMLMCVAILALMPSIWAAAQKAGGLLF